MLKEQKSMWKVWPREVKIDRKTKIIAGVILSLVMVLVVTAIVGTDKKRSRNILKVLPQVADVEIEGFVFTETGESGSRWEVRAEKASYKVKKNLATFDNVHITLDTTEGKVYTMTADAGQMFTDKKDIKIEGNVVITSNTGEKFATDYLNYSDEQKKFFTDAPVTMESNRIKIRGTGLTLLVENGQLNLNSMVRAKIK